MDQLDSGIADRSTNKHKQVFQMKTALVFQHFMCHGHYYGQSWNWFVEELVGVNHATWPNHFFIKQVWKFVSMTVHKARQMRKQCSTGASNKKQYNTVQGCEGRTQTMSPTGGGGGCGGKFSPWDISQQVYFACSPEFAVGKILMATFLCFSSCGRAQQTSAQATVGQDILLKFAAGLLRTAA